jgi:prepilin-type N-terminal cleavage/methylation domain-containing protein
MIRRARKRLAAERGFTLIELMMSAAIGTVIMLAAFGLLDATIRTFGSSGHRTDVAQRGRLMLDEVTRQLRTPVCLSANGTSAILDATATSIRFYSDMTGSDFRVGSPQPAIVELTFSGGILTQTTTRDTGTGTQTTTRRLGERLSQVVDGATTQPYFRYWALEPVKTPPSPREANVPLSPPVGTNDRPRIARIAVAFRVGSEDSNARHSADFDNEVYLRSIDQANAMGAIRCSS